MGTGSSDLTPPNNAPGHRPRASPGEVYTRVRLDGGGGGGIGAAAHPSRNARQGSSHGRRSSWSPPARPQTVVQKTKLVKNTCNVRKDSLKLSKSIEGGVERYHLQFRYDAEGPCLITVYFFAEEILPMIGGRSIYQPKYPGEGWVVGPHPFPAGPNQTYSTSSIGGYLGIDLSNIRPHELTGGPTTATSISSSSTDTTSNNNSSYPITIVIKPCKDEQGLNNSNSSSAIDVTTQITLANLSPLKGGRGGAEGYEARFVKQKIETSDGVFVLQEIYGIAGVTPTTTTSVPSVAAALDKDEKKGGERREVGGLAVEEEGGSDVSSADCVICLTNKRELVILPCRHMCVCRYCAAECIQSQDSRCPICRNPAQALLKLTYDDEGCAPI